MLLNGGTLDGRRYLSAASMRLYATPQTGDLPTGFFQNETYGNRGANYGWGIGTCILRTPHDGVAVDALARDLRTRRRLGHAGLDRSGEGRGYILMVQRSGFPNSDASDVRRAFQQAAATALTKN